MITKQDIRRTAKEIQATLDTPEGQKAVKELSATLPTAIMAFRTLRKANKARKEGNYLKGLYYLVLWIGLTNNAGMDRLTRAVDNANQNNVAVNLPPAPRIGHTNTGGLFN